VPYTSFSITDNCKIVHKPGFEPKPHVLWLIRV